MPTTRPLRTAWKSLWKKSRSGRARTHRGTNPEMLEARVLPAAVSITASVDGYARDANRDDAFTVLNTTGTNLLVRNTTGVNTGYEHSMLEFDLTNISTAFTVDSATLVLNVSQFTRDGIKFPQLTVVGYTGNGAIELTDASVAGTEIGTATVNARGELRITLDTAFIRSQGGNFLGLRLENPTLNGPYAIYSALESGLADPVLELDLSLNIPDKVFNVDEQRPNGTIVGNAGIGNNANYLVLSGDPTGVFDFNTTTGLIRVADSAQLQFALQQQYVLEVQATLPDGSVGTYNVTINVKNIFGVNNPPTVRAANFTIEEFSPEDTVVGQVIAIDPDSADPLSYSIESGNIGGAFKIDSATGVITVNDQTVLSFHDHPFFTLTIKVRDTRIPRLETTEKVQIFLTPRLNASPASSRVQLQPVVDAELRDGVAGAPDGIFESMNQAASVMRVDPGAIHRRAVMEFDLSGISSGRILKSAFLTIDVSANVGNPIPISVFGYVGNGVITGPDAVAGSLIGSTSLETSAAANQRIFIELDPALIQQLLGTSNDLGLVLRNDVNGNGVNISTNEGPAGRAPTLQLVFEDVADDVVFNDPTTQGLTVARSNATGTAFTTFAASALRQGVTFSELVTGDFNGDGRLDIAGRNSANGQVLVALAAANQFVTGASWTTFSTVTTFSDIVVGDFNGDGRDDIAGRSAQGQLLVAVSTGTRFSNAVFDTLPTDLRSLSNVKVGDFNGDGRDDLMGIVTSTGEVVVSISNGGAFTSSVWGTIPLGSSADINVGDFNGDGRDDIFFRQNTSSLKVLRSTGSSFVESLFGTLLATTHPYIGFRMGDFNGDGLQDILGFTAQGATTIYRSTGSSFAPVGGGVLPGPLTTVDPSDIVIGDFNRDGKSDVLVKKTLTNTVGGVTTTTQSLYVALGTSGGLLDATLWGTLNTANTLTLLGVGNY